MIHHHHHYHHHMEGGKLTLKDIGRDLKHTFTAHNAEQAGMAALPAFTTGVGGLVGGPPGAAAGAAAGYFADKGIQNAIHGDGIRKGTIAHVRYHKKKRYEARIADPYDEKRHQKYSKSHQAAIEHYNTSPYHYLSKDKDHQKNLREARKQVKKMKEQTSLEDGIAGEGFYHRGHRAYDDSEYSAKFNSHMSKLRKSSSPWIEHVKEYRSQHPGITYSQALKEAKTSYHR